MKLHLGKIGMIVCVHVFNVCGASQVTLGQMKFRARKRKMPDIKTARGFLR